MAAAAAGLSARLDRLNDRGRLAGVDLARGLAVVGMFAAHMLWTTAWDWDDPSTWTDVANGRSSILFATLAGVSIGLSTGGSMPVAGARLGDARGRLAVRAGLLWVIGIALISTRVPVYVILPAYAILFLLAIPLLPLGPRVLLPLAGGLTVVMPFVHFFVARLPFWSEPTGPLLSLVIGWEYPFTVWSAFIVAGLGIGRLDLRAARVQVWLLGAGAALAVLGYGLADASRAGEASVVSSPVEELWASVWTARAHSSGLLEVVGSGGFAIAVLGLCLLLCRPWSGARTNPLAWIVLPLRAVGAMPLTAYAAQIVGWAIVATIVLGSAQDLAAFRELEPFWPFTLWTIGGCTAWALLVGRGPLEWVLDRAARRATRSDEPTSIG